MNERNGRQKVRKCDDRFGRAGEWEREGGKGGGGVGVKREGRGKERQRWRRYIQREEAEQSRM
jgi:hypothetical protein